MLQSSSFLEPASWIPSPVGVGSTTRILVLQACLPPTVGFQSCMLLHWAKVASEDRCISVSSVFYTSMHLSYSFSTSGTICLEVCSDLLEQPARCSRTGPTTTFCILVWHFSPSSLPSQTPKAIRITCVHDLVALLRRHVVYTAYHPGK